MNADTPLQPRGVFAAAATAMTADYSVDLGRTTAHWFRLLDEGCHGLAVFGTTGEANSLAAAERMSTLEAAVSAGVPASKLWPGTGCCALPEAIELTRHAMGLGVAGVLVLPPFYYKGVSDEGLADWYSTLIEQVNDPRLSLVLYHFPAMSGVAISHVLIETLQDRHPGTVTGIKDSTGDLDGALDLVRRFPDVSVLPGADPLLLPVSAQGGAGCITAIANLASPLLRCIWDGHNEPAPNDEALQAHSVLCELRQALGGPDLLPSIKALLATLRNDSGWRHLRPPLRSLDDHRWQPLVESLADPLRRLGEFSPVLQKASS